MLTVMLSAEPSGPGRVIPFETSPGSGYRTPQSGCRGLWQPVDAAGSTDSPLTQLAAKYGVPDLVGGWPGEAHCSFASDYEQLAEAAGQVWEDLRHGKLSMSRIRLTKQGAVIDDAEIDLSRRGYLSFHDGYVDRTQVSTLLSDGGTLSVFGIQEINADIEAACARLGALSGSRVGATLFYSSAGSPGYRAHYDEFHSLLIQLSGSKTWRVRKGPVDTPAVGHAWPKLESVLLERGDIEEYERGDRDGDRSQLTLSPGSALWLPPGWIHSGMAGSDESVHITFALNAWSVFEILQLVATEAGSVAELRSEIPRSELYDGHLGNLCASALSQLAEIVAADSKVHLRLLSRVLAEAPSAPGPTQSGPFQEPGDVDLSCAVAVRTCQECIEVHLGDRLIRLLPGDPEYSQAVKLLGTA